MVWGKLEMGEIGGKFRRCQGNLGGFGEVRCFGEKLGKFGGLEANLAVSRANWGKIGGNLRGLGQIGGSLEVLRQICGNLGVNLGNLG